MNLKIKIIIITLFSSVTTMKATIPLNFHFTKIVPIQGNLAGYNFEDALYFNNQVFIIGSAQSASMGKWPIFSSIKNGDVTNIPLNLKCKSLHTAELRLSDQLYLRISYLDRETNKDTLRYFTVNTKDELNETFDSSLFTNASQAAIEKLFYDPNDELLKLNNGNLQYINTFKVNNNSGISIFQFNDHPNINLPPFVYSSKTGHSVIFGFYKTERTFMMYPTDMDLYLGSLNYTFSGNQIINVPFSAFNLTDKEVSDSYLYLKSISDVKLDYKLKIKNFNDSVCGVKFTSNIQPGIYFREFKNSKIIFSTTENQNISINNSSYIDYQNSISKKFLFSLSVVCVLLLAFMVLALYHPIFTAQNWNNIGKLSEFWKNVVLLSLGGTLTTILGWTIFKLISLLTLK